MSLRHLVWFPKYVGKLGVEGRNVSFSSFQLVEPVRCRINWLIVFVENRDFVFCVVIAHRLVMRGMQIRFTRTVPIASEPQNGDLSVGRVETSAMSLALLSSLSCAITLSGTFLSSRLMVW